MALDPKLLEISSGAPKKRARCSTSSTRTRGDNPRCQAAPLPPRVLRRRHPRLLIDRCRDGRRRRKLPPDERRRRPGTWPSSPRSQT